MKTEKPLSEKIREVKIPKGREYPEISFKSVLVEDVTKAVERLKEKLKLLKYLEEEDIDEIFGDLK